MTKPQQDKYMTDYNRLMFGGNYELVRVENPANVAKAHGAENCFVFLQEISGKTITQKSTKKNDVRPKHQIKPGSDNNIRIKSGGYIRRADAAKYLGISMRTLTNWQQRQVIPVVQVGHRITLFRTADLDRCLKRFTLKAAGDET